MNNSTNIQPTQHKANKTPSKFTVARFTSWQTQPVARHIHYNSLGESAIIAPPVVATSDNSGNWKLCQAPGKLIYPNYTSYTAILDASYQALRLPARALGLLGVRDEPKASILTTNQPFLATNKSPNWRSGRCIRCSMPAGMVSTQLAISNWPLCQAFKRLAYSQFTTIEALNYASGESFIRKTSPKKRVPLNDLAYRPTDKNDPEANQNLSKGQKTKEKNLTRYKKGDKMLTTGISYTGQKQIKLFGRCVQEQAKRSNKKVFNKKSLYKSNLAYGCHLTLTLPGDYPNLGYQTFESIDYETGEITTTERLQPNWVVLKTMFRAFIEAIAYRVERDNPGCSSDLLYTYVIEDQERGAPHWHLLFAHFLPMNQVKQLWSSIIAKYTDKNYTPNEINACATVKGVRSYSNYLTKYFLKSDFKVFGRSWGISDKGRELIKKSYCPVMIHFDRYQDATNFLASVGTRLMSEKVALVGNLVMVRTENTKIVLPYKTKESKPFIPPSLWCSDGRTAFNAFWFEMSKIVHKVVIPKVHTRNKDRPPEKVPLFEISELLL
jgi:hypothetical protein